MKKKKANEKQLTMNYKKFNCLSIFQMQYNFIIIILY